MKRFCCKLAPLLPRSKGWNNQPCQSGGQRPRSRDAKDQFGGLAEDLFSTRSAHSVE